MRNALAFFLGLAFVVGPILIITGGKPSKIGMAVIIIFTLIYIAKWSDSNDRERRGQNNSWQQPSDNISYQSTNSQKKQTYFNNDSMPQYIRDTSGNPIAYTITDKNRIAIYTPNGTLKGWYDSDFNRTFNTAGNPVAQGNALFGLIN